MIVGREARVSNAEIDPSAHASGGGGLRLSGLDGLREHVDDGLILLLSHLQHGGRHGSLCLALRGDDGGCGEIGHGARLGEES